MKDVNLKFNDIWVDIEDGWLCIGDDENQILLEPKYFKKLLKAINYTRCCKSVKGEQVPTFDEFIDKFNLEADRDNEYFFDNEYFDAMGLYYKYAEHYGINP